MARKQNQKALYEAIRQGQARIAEGLKTGQMRSDRKRFNNITQSGLYAAQNTGSSRQAAEEDVSGDTSSGLSSKTVLIIVAVAVQIVVLGFGIWFGALYYGGDKKEPEVSAPVAQKKTQAPEPQRSPASPIAVQIQQPRQIKETRPVAVVPEETKPLAVETADPSAGNNVVVIQGIQESRKEELLPLSEFFKKKGIGTEVIVRNGYALLVTVQGFNVNPESEGTPGFELVRQVRTLGLAYVKETGDTKFGLKPFQDCYGLLK